MSGKADAKFVEGESFAPKVVNKLDTSALNVIQQKLSKSHRVDRAALLDRGILKDTARLSSSLMQAQMSLMRRKTEDELNNMLSKRRNVDDLVKSNVLKGAPGTHGMISAGMGELKKKQTEDMLSKMYANRPTMSELMRKSIVIDVGMAIETDTITNSPRHLRTDSRLESLFSPCRVEAPEGVEIAEVGCGYSFSVMLSKDGRMFSWGKGDNGKNGQGSMRSVPVPTLIDMGNKKIVDVQCGDNHSICTTSEGQVFTWGWGWNHRLGHDSTADELKPRAVELLAGVKVVNAAAGAYQSCFVGADQKLYTCGWGKNGRLGHGAETDKRVPLPIAFSSGVKTVKAGSNHVLFVSTDGKVYGFGRNDYGQLGLGHRTNVSTPTEVKGIPAGVARLACGWSTSAVVMTNGDMYVFGKSEAYQLGAGDTKSVDVPTKLAVPGGAVHTVFTANAMLVLNKLGDVYVVGRGPLGELGLGPGLTHTTTLTPIPEIKGQVKDIGSGVSHCICLCKDGSLYVWGEGKSCYTGEDALRASSLQLVNEDLDVIGEGEEDEDN